MYSRKLDDAVLSFGHEGALYRQSFVMYDKQTDSLWVHTTGEAVKGKLKGKVLTFLPSTITSWKKWKQLHPKTTVLTGQRARGGMGRFNLSRDPTKYGLSIGQGPTPRLYPFTVLMKQHVIQDTHDGKPIVVVFDAETKTAKAYAAGERTFRWEGGKMLDKSGAEWDLLKGLRLTSKAARLHEIPATMWLVRRWRGFHPRQTIYGATQEK